MRPPRPMPPSTPLTARGTCCSKTTTQGGGGTPLAASRCLRHCGWAAARTSILLVVCGDSSVVSPSASYAPTPPGPGQTTAAVRGGRHSPHRSTRLSATGGGTRPPPPVVDVPTGRADGRAHRHGALVPTAISVPAAAAPLGTRPPPRCRGAVGGGGSAPRRPQQPAVPRCGSCNSGGSARCSAGGGGCARGGAPSGGPLPSGGHAAQQTGLLPRRSAGGGGGGRGDCGGERLAVCSGGEGRPAAPPHAPTGAAAAGAAVAGVGVGGAPGKGGSGRERRRHTKRITTGPPTGALRPYRRCLCGRSRTQRGLMRDGDGALPDGRRL